MSVRMRPKAPAAERQSAEVEIGELRAKVSFLEQMLATAAARGYGASPVPAGRGSDASALPATAPVVLYFDNQVERGEWLRSAVHRLPRHHIPRQTK